MDNRGTKKSLRDFQGDGVEKVGGVLFGGRGRENEQKMSFQVQAMDLLLPLQPPCDCWVHNDAMTNNDAGVCDAKTCGF